MGWTVPLFLGVVVGLVFVCVVSTEPQSSLRYTCSTTEGNTSLPKQVGICVFEDIIWIVYTFVVMPLL